MACPNSCGSIVLLANPLTDCITSTRNKTLQRILFFDCNTTLPDPVTDMAMAALFSSGAIVASMPLANITWGDPITEDILIDDCSPARQIITGRELTFEDRIAVAKTSGSPAVTDNYWDYKFWQDKLDNQLLMRFGLVFCDGDVVIPRDQNEVPLGATMLVYLSSQKSQTPGGPSVEFKRGSVRFSGDPLAFYTAEPLFNYIEAGIPL